jgi:SAM-dependent methyltransferase
MSFSKEWDKLYQANLHLSIWPWSDLVSYVMRYARPKDKGFKVLELGCGAGANIPFFSSLGMEYYAIEGSETIVKKLQDKFPELKKNIMATDFTKGIPFSHQFDLVVDRGSLTHNTAEGIRNCLSLAISKMKDEAKFIGIDYFSTLHSAYKYGKEFKDINTRTRIKKGNLAETGCVHFSDRAHLEELFSGFRIEILEHKISKREIPNDNYIDASWNLVARKELK